MRHLLAIVLGASALICAAQSATPALLESGYNARSASPPPAPKRTAEPAQITVSAPEYRVNGKCYYDVAQFRTHALRTWGDAPHVRLLPYTAPSLRTGTAVRRNREYRSKSVDEASQS